MTAHGGESAAGSGTTSASGQRSQNLEWFPDAALGSGFEACRLPIADGTPRVGEYATLVRFTESIDEGVDGPSSDEAGAAASSRPRPVAVLYVHGFCDYFFQAHLAEAIAAVGAAFYAIDLRGYGRSLEAHLEAGGDPNMLPDVALHAADLDAAVAAIRAAGHERVVVLGHSMGGLIAARWAAARHADSTRASIDGLILNSPWLELNENAFLRGPITKIVGGLAPWAPRVIVGGLQPYYGRALHESTGGEWDYNLDWKPIEGFPVRAKWFTSIRRAHGNVQAGINVGVPTLVLSSDRTGSHVSDHPDVLTTDSVLSVEQIRDGARRLGPTELVEYRAIPGGAHDLALSPEPARSEYLAAVTDWLREQFG